jgi:hypothetical protein
METKLDAIRYVVGFCLGWHGCHLWTKAMIRFAKKRGLLKVEWTGK